MDRTPQDRSVIGKMVPAKDLLLRDKVELWPHGYSTATVINVDKENITLFRPYVTTSEFSSTAGVIPYIGIETFIIPKNSRSCVVLVDREEFPPE